MCTCDTQDLTIGFLPSALAGLALFRDRHRRVALREVLCCRLGRSRWQLPRCDSNLYHERLSLLVSILQRRQSFLDRVTEANDNPWKVAQVLCEHLQAVRLLVIVVFELLAAQRAKLAFGRASGILELCRRQHVG